MVIVVDSLKKMAIENDSDFSLTKEQAIESDITEEFHLWLRDMIESGKTVIITILGETRSGKSTCGIALMYYIQYLLNVTGKNKSIKRKDLINFIYSDQTEYIRTFDMTQRNIVELIDEVNLMGNTGLNATSESMLLKDYSNKFATMYRHRLLCSPRDIIDPNCTVVLEYDGIDPDNMTSSFIVKYRNPVSLSRTIIGSISINVNECIKNWVGDVKTIVEEKGIENSTDTEKKLVNTWAKKDPYIAYQVKKNKRLDLFKEDGVRDVRDFERGMFIYEVIMKNKIMSMNNKFDKNEIGLDVDETLRQHKHISTLLDEHKIVTSALAVLNLNFKKFEIVANKDKYWKKGGEALWKRKQSYLFSVGEKVEREIEIYNNLRKKFYNFMNYRGEVINVLSPKDISFKDNVCKIILRKTDDEDFIGFKIIDFDESFMKKKFNDFKFIVSGDNIQYILPKDKIMKFINYGISKFVDGEIIDIEDKIIIKKDCFGDLIEFSSNRKVGYLQGSEVKE